MSNTHNHSQQTDKLAPPTLVRTEQALADLVTDLMQAAVVAVDTESNSLYAYHEQVCLIQFTANGKDYLLDPLALDNLQALAPLFATPDIEKVFHACDYDLMVLKRDFDFECRNLFDTMWAGRILGWNRVGLGNILDNRFDVKPKKRYQRYNWGKRPLDPEAIKYARTDTHYLLTLRKRQIQALQEKGRWAEAQEIFDYLCHNVADPPERDLDALFWRIKGVYKLNKPEQDVLYRLHLWRERQAEAMDRPPFKVIGNRRLITLAKVQPHTYEGLADARLSKFQLRRFGKGILRAIKSKASAPPTPHNHGPRPSRQTRQLYQALRNWRKEVAANRGVDSDVILPNDTLWDIATQRPATQQALLDIPGIGPWRKDTYGPDIMKLLEEM